MSSHAISSHLILSVLSYPVLHYIVCLFLLWPLRTSVPFRSTLSRPRTFRWRTVSMRSPPSNFIGTKRWSGSSRAATSQQSIRWYGRTFTKHPPRTGTAYCCCCLELSPSYLILFYLILSYPILSNLFGESVLPSSLPSFITIRIHRHWQPFLCLLSFLLSLQQFQRCHDTGERNYSQLEYIFPLERQSNLKRQWYGMIWYDMISFCSVDWIRLDWIGLNWCESLSFLRSDSRKLRISAVFDFDSSIQCSAAQCSAVQHTHHILTTRSSSASVRSRTHTLCFSAFFLRFHLYNRIRGITPFFI